MLTPEAWQKAQTAKRDPNWRLLDTGLHPGAWNMAVDEAILKACRRGEVPPTLRFYGWQPHAVSLGYFQHGEREIDFAACQKAGLDLVRRLTGGRAVLHSRELTYSLVVREDYPGLPLSITASYCYLSQGLLKGLTHLGLQAALTVPSAAYARKLTHPDSAACFDAPSYYELTVNGKKLIGSAQVRKYGYVLQHGSLLLDADPGEIVRVLRLTPSAQETLRQLLQAHALNLHQALGRPVSYEEAREAMALGFAEALKLKLKPAELTEAEQEDAKQLAVETYGSAAWTKRR